ncbi:uncharacterized mitochondrial protein AtMg00860-like [Typha angustifolia]|uniref:uncharacterized mitochondrial protein AtMg00860-like n=1 Tax=Typha angustifolia TaxID=59011 RepID=UPI003C2C9409
MVDWPIPTNQRELREFHGLMGYYQRFVANYDKIAALLTSLLRKGEFQWMGKAMEAFETLKTVMSTVPVLALPDFSKLFVVECDTSGEGIGAILVQQNRSMAYE